MELRFKNFLDTLQRKVSSDTGRVELQNKYTSYVRSPHHPHKDTLIIQGAIEGAPWEGQLGACGDLK